MSERAWRTAYASVIGTSHEKTDAPCQDAGRCRVVRALDGREVLVAAVADGAGSATLSQEGAALAVKSFLEEFGAVAAMHSDLEDLDLRFVQEWVVRLNAEIVEMAEAGRTSRDYACTFLGAVVGPDHAVYVQVGDGAIVASGPKPGVYDWVFWPQHGEFANQTNFVTMEQVLDVLEFRSVPGRIEEIALFSDGLERLVLNLAAKTVHSPALAPVFGWLAGTQPDAGGEMSDALVAYLSSSHVNGRTDDDKTLVMATRADPARMAAAPSGDVPASPLLGEEDSSATRGAASTDG